MLNIFIRWVLGWACPSWPSACQVSNCHQTLGFDRKYIVSYNIFSELQYIKVVHLFFFLHFSTIGVLLPINIEKKRTICDLNFLFLAVALFTFVGFVQMTIWAKRKHKIYTRVFKDYPKLRKSILPFILWHSYKPVSGQDPEMIWFQMRERGQTGTAACKWGWFMTSSGKDYEVKSTFQQCLTLSCKMMSNIFVFTMVCHLGI